MDVVPPPKSVPGEDFQGGTAVEQKTTTFTVHVPPRNPYQIRVYSTIGTREQFILYRVI